MNLIDDESNIIDSKLGNFDWVRLFSKITNTKIGDDVFIGFSNLIQNSVIGNNVQIASRSVIGFANENYAVIEDCVWIGAQAIIDPGITVHEGAVIGARTHVTKDVAPFTVVKGSSEYTHERKVTGLKKPNFRKFLLYHLQLKERNMYIKADANGNYISDRINSSYYEYLTGIS
ncbi:acyltransferase [Bombilactobacillus thymidiniphilus]|uniref:Acetyltransferase n=1 Tax=Bombilactobacillus thymidiniphilus TaxID=2923363 RepID=A0ABY4PEG2_9LACO|nr:DapH/DapD/GlmU-related protein [Bombilactobacillus thymidiniphilus]UQS84178.1 hypothetical protein MOO47_03235 [Bombilactobacillus thymidiniphilus]